MQELDTGKRDQFRLDTLTSEQAVAAADTIVGIYKDVWLATYPSAEAGITRDDLATRFEDMPNLVHDWQKNILSDTNRQVWLAKSPDRNKTAGFCIAKKGTEANELEYIYILPEFQGKGLGSKLMRPALDWMGTEKPLVLFGAAYNNNAIAFYKHYGFTLSDEAIPPKVLPNGKSIPSMKMVKTFPIVS